MRWSVDPRDAKRVIGGSGETVCYADTYMIARKIVRDHRQFWEEKERVDMDGAKLIAAERERQIVAEYWTPQHDDQHRLAELTLAGFSYASLAASQVRLGAGCVNERLPVYWPWDEAWWRPSEDPIRNLIKAGALIAAEIDRLQRAQQTNGGML